MTVITYEHQEVQVEKGMVEDLGEGLEAEEAEEGEQSGK